MVVYWEYAFLENFILDGLLLFLALKCARLRCRTLNLIFAAGIGAAEAILFPLVAFPDWAAYVVKFAGGAVIALIATGRAGIKPHLVVLTAFFLMTFALGGLLVALYSFMGTEFIGTNAFLVEQAPVALVLGTAGVFAVMVFYAARGFYRYRRIQRNLFACMLRSEGKTIRVTGFADSGNLLTFHGEPVCVVSPIAALALFGKGQKEVGRIHVGTVNGSREAPVFACKLSVVSGGGRCFERDVFITVGDVGAKEYKLILHSAIWEDEHETHTSVEKVARKNKIWRKRCKLPMRK